MAGARGLAAIRRDYTVDDLRVHLAAAGIDRTVLVEAARCDDAETAEFLALAASTPEIAGVVGWASLTSLDLARTIEGHRAGVGGELLVGIRDQAQGQPDDVLDQPEVRAGLATVASFGLVNELVVRSAQLPSVARAATRLADCPVRPGPPRQAADREPADGRTGVRCWHRSRPVRTWWRSCPVWSRRRTGPRGRSRTCGPYVETAVELFGPDRLMFGSDWPVCELAATYEQVTSAVEEILGGRPADIFGGTAVRAYELEI